MLNPFIHLISNIIFLINWGLIIWFVLSMLINLHIVNQHHPIVAKLYATLSRLLEPLLRPIRRLLEKLFPSLGIDLSPIVLILLLRFVEDLLYRWFYTI